MYKAVIIDDESLAREQIINLLDDHDDVEVVAECSNGLEGYHAINQHKPHIVFLDVQMPKVNGFEMLELLDEAPVVIFSTAYDQYALKAFEVHAVDYLLKPFSEKRFLQALEQARKKLTSVNSVKHSDGLIESYLQQQGLTRLVVKKSGKIIIIPVPEIYYLEATGDYVAIHTKGERYLKLQTMKYFEEQLEKTSFVRVHRSYIVNLDFIQRMEPYTKDSWVVIMQNEARVYVSRPGMKKLKSMLNLD
ncbi:MAG TPA: LytTR family transcriptional regulator DNA-binding domain-containing protein [Bacteroidales bacterium]|nr:LytTR family transcriptional regulator DNA-binding domain-containing protein [Bacteroidales bacterium]